ncbi:MAG: hypothetical protein J6L89_00490 [Clostridia bacterium]|nr:hypothetical protein [Clostridia bacterium]
MDKKQMNITKEDYCCAICAHGKKAADSDMILCSKKGVLQPDYKCRKFKYDPLRRQPRLMPTLPEYTFDDFKL